MNQITVTAAPPMSQSTAFVLSFCRSFVGSLARSYLLLHIFFPFYFCLSLSLPCALFIAIIPRYALASHPRSFGDSIRNSCFLFCTSRRSTKRGWCPPAKRTSPRGYVATGNSALDRCRVLFSSVPFLTSLHFVSSDKTGGSLGRRSLTNDAVRRNDRFYAEHFRRSRSFARLCVNNRGGIRIGEPCRSRSASLRATFLRNSETLS